MKAKDTYTNGQPISQQHGDTLTYYFKDGGIKARGNYVDGQFQGRWIFNKKEGYLWQVGHFHNNQKHGKWVRYKPDGSIEKAEEFSQGKRVK